MTDWNRKMLFAWIGAFAMMVAACSSKNDPAECPAPHPTFRLTIEAGGKPLPWNLEVEVKYGGGVEVYDAAHPTVATEVLDCEPVTDVDAGADASGSGKGKLLQLVCELWTDGAATVKVRGEGYPERELELAATSDDCGLVLSEETLTLYDKD